MKKICMFSILAFAISLLAYSYASLGEVIEKDAIISISVTFYPDELFYSEPIQLVPAASISISKERLVDILGRSLIKSKFGGPRTELVEGRYVISLETDKKVQTIIEINHEDWFYIDIGDATYFCYNVELMSYLRTMLFYEMRVKKIGFSKKS